MSDDEIAIDTMSGGGSGGPPSFARPPTPRRRWSLLAAAAFLLIVALTLVAVVPPLRELATRRPASPTATSIFAVADAETATATFALWAPLESRPLALPTLAPGTPCPRAAARTVTPELGPALGAGPVYAVGGGPTNVVEFTSPKGFGSGTSGWGGQKVIWYLDPAHAAGPIVVRGRRIDGPGAMRFNGGVDQRSNPGILSDAPLLPTLHMLTEPDYGGTPVYTWITFTRVQMPGCYAYEVDGLTFTEVIVFQVVFQ